MGSAGSGFEPGVGVWVGVVSVELTASAVAGGSASVYVDIVEVPLKKSLDER